MINDSIDNLRLELNNKNMRKSISVRKNDTKTRSIHVSLANHGSVIDLSNAYMADLMIKKPDGTECDQDMVLSGNEMQYTWRTQDVSVPGECICQVRVTFKDLSVLFSPYFYLYVYDQIISDEIIKSENDYSMLTQKITETALAANTAIEFAGKTEGYRDEAEAFALSAEEAYQNALKESESAMDSANEASEYLRQIEENDNKSYQYSLESKEYSEKAFESMQGAESHEQASRENSVKSELNVEVTRIFKREVQQIKQDIEEKDTEISEKLKKTAEYEYCANQAKEQAIIESLKTKQNAENTLKIYSDIVEKLVNGDFRGEQGEKGDPGESGITAPVSGYFTLYVDEKGDLYAVTEDESYVPLEFDVETGNLYMVIADGGDL